MRLANIISYLFHPGFLPTAGLGLLINMDTYLQHSIHPRLKWFLLGIVFVNTFIFPLLVLLLLKSRGAVSSLKLGGRSERIIPFGVTVIFYLFTYNILQKTPTPPLILSIFLGFTLSSFLVFIINFYWKISVHMVGISSVLAALLLVHLQFSANYIYEITFVALVWGLIGYSRLKLRAHSSFEVYLGGLVGLVSVFAISAFGITI